jgi:hypothetical protein
MPPSGVAWLRGSASDLAISAFRPLQRAKRMFRESPRALALAPSLTSE